MGFGHRVYKSYDPRAKVDQAHRRPGVQRHRQEPAARNRARARAHRAAGRLLRHPQALSERRLLLRADLPGDGLPDGDVPGAVRHPAHRRLDRAVGRDAARPGAEDRAAAADLHRRRRSATTSRGTNAGRIGAPWSKRCSLFALALQVCHAGPEVRRRPRVGTSASAGRDRAAAVRLARHRADPQVHQGTARRHRRRRRPSRPGTTRRRSTRSRW